MEIWNEEVIQNKKFPAKLKFADISPIFKKLESIFVKNYRPVSVLPVVSKLFERLMQKQTNDFIEKHLSPYLCGYRLQLSICTFVYDRTMENVSR